MLVWMVEMEMDLELAAELFLEQLRSLAARKLQHHFSSLFKFHFQDEGGLPDNCSASSSAGRKPCSAPKVLVETARSLNTGADWPRVEKRRVLIVKL